MLLPKRCAGTVRPPASFVPSFGGAAGFRARLPHPPFAPPFFCVGFTSGRCLIPLAVCSDHARRSPIGAHLEKFELDLNTDLYCHWFPVLQGRIEAPLL